MAKSAATILAMVSEQILLDDTAELGPTDPQLSVNGRPSPAGAILQQFDFARDQIKNDASSLPAWIPLLQACGPSLLQECRNTLNLSVSITSRWLMNYMFKNDPSANQKAQKLAAWLADDQHFKTHMRKVTLADLQARGCNAKALGSDPDLHKLVRRYYIALMLTFEGTGLFKLFENSNGKRTAMNFNVQIVPPQAAPTQGTQPAPAQPPSPPNTP